MEKFKPQLLPNEPAGEAPDWESRLQPIEEFMFSTKLDGARVELFSGEPARGRSMKVLKSVKIQEMATEFNQHMGLFGGCFEAEFYSPNMTFSEIMHFFKVEDIDDPKHYTKWMKLFQHPTKEWPFPGRTPEWLCTWHDDLKFYVFDYATAASKADRYMMYNEAIRDIRPTDQWPLSTDPEIEGATEVAVAVKQFKLNHIDAFYQAYDQAIMDGHEGLVCVHKDTPYKNGRHTLKSGTSFKAKENKLEFDGKVMYAEEGTVARPGAPKTTNELGRSVTSKLAEDRIPGGFCKGFRVRMEDGRELIVSLNGWSHPEKEELLNDPSDYVGQWVRFTGMKPVKEGGMPRHAQVTKGQCIRDEK